MDAILPVLQGLTPFAGLSAAILARLAQAARPRALVPGETLFPQGAPRVALYVIAEGQVEVSRSHQGQVEVLVVLGAGEMLGEGVLFSDAPTSTSASAVGHVSLIEMPREALRQALVQDKILEPLKMGIDEFIEVCDKFTNRRIFKQDAKGALRKDRRGNLEKTNYDNVPA